MEHEDPQHAGDGGRDRVGPDQERLEGLGRRGGFLSACVASSSEQRQRQHRDRDEKITVVTMAR